MKIEFKNLCKHYADMKAVDDLSLEVESGALHFFLGPSGCGKTTTLRMLAGLEKPTSGQILFDGRDVTHASPSDRKIGMVFQNYALWPHMTVRQNIEYGLKIKKMSKAEIEKTLGKVLEYTRLTRFVSRFPGQLSGGQQQRVALARALAIEPTILLLDEPLSNLDAKLRLEMRATISQIHRDLGITTVYVTHDQKEALSMGTSISLMFAGKLVQSGTPRELYHQPSNRFVAEFIGATNILKGHVKEISGERIMADTPIGLVEAVKPPFKFDLGEEVEVIFRPESVFLSAEHQDKVNTFPVEIKDRCFLGEQEQFMLKFNEDLEIMGLQMSGHSIENQKNIFTHIAPAHVRLLKPGAGLGPGT